MNNIGVKTLFCTAALLTVLMVEAPDGFADKAKTGLSPDAEQENIISKRDHLKDTITAHGAEIEAIDGLLLNLKLDLEWLELKWLEFEARDIFIPQELIESRDLIREKQNRAARERERLLEQIQAHTLHLKTLDAAMAQTTVQARKSPENGDAEPGDAHFTEEDLGPTDFEKELRTRIKAMGIEDWVELINQAPGLRLEVQLPILFAPGQSTLIGSYQGFLEKIAALARPYEVFVHVNGVTDGTKSKKISNIDLGAQRAAAIVNHLVAHGLPPSVFKITSRGEYPPGSQVDTKSPSLNRRAEITVYFSPAG